MLRSLIQESQASRYHQTSLVDEWPKPNVRYNVCYFKWQHDNYSESKRVELDDKECHILASTNQHKRNLHYHAHSELLPSHYRQPSH